MPGTKKTAFFTEAIKAGFKVLAVLAPLLLMGSVVTARDRPGSSISETHADINPHDFSNRRLCVSCHGAVPPMLKFDAVTVCTRCHTSNVGNHPVVGHPVGKVPRINMNRNLPLSRDRKLVCYTCHDQHNRSRHAKMLRIEYVKLCASCHRGY